MGKVAMVLGMGFLGARGIIIQLREAFTRSGIMVAGLGYVTGSRFSGKGK